MTTIHFKNFSDSSIEITYTKGYSRPSKSLLTPDLYNVFKCIKDTNLLPNLSKENLRIRYVKMTYLYLTFILNL